MVVLKVLTAVVGVEVEVGGGVDVVEVVEVVGWVVVVGA